MNNQLPIISKIKININYTKISSKYLCKIIKQSFISLFQSFQTCIQKPPVRVAITGAAQQIEYSQIFTIVSGEILRPNQPIYYFNGVVIEIQDCAFPLVKWIVDTDNQAIQFKNIYYAQEDQKNGKIFTETGKQINEHASRDIKFVVVSNPSNINCLILANQIKDIPNENFTDLTILDHNRAQHQLAEKLGFHSSYIRRIAIFGNHSNSMQYRSQYIEYKTSVDQQWVSQTFILTVQQRGAEIIKARKLSSAASVGNAAMNHITTWVNGTAEGDFTSIAIPSDGSYGIPKGLIFSFPVSVKYGKYTIVQGLAISPFYQGLLDKTIQELVDERNAVDHLLK